MAGQELQQPLPRCHCLCGIGIPLRYFSLCALTLQTTAVVLMTRYSKVSIGDSEEAYASTSLVVATEFVKFALSVLFIYVFDVPHARAELGEKRAAQAEDGEDSANRSSLQRIESKSSFDIWLNIVYTQNFASPLETLKVSVPALLYTLQNNMIYVALANLEATTFQVGYQSKVITTAVLSVYMLNRTLSATKWIALVMLTVGIICTQVKADGSRTPEPNINRSVGVAAVLICAFCSAFAGVYFEKILKGTNPTVWVRNAQLAFFSLVVGVITYLVTEPSGTRFFQGYNPLVVSIIATQAAGGLIIAVVMKYADNILKGFATTMSIVLCGLISAGVMGFSPTWLFFLGSALTIIATMMYST